MVCGVQSDAYGRGRGRGTVEFRASTYGTSTIVSTVRYVLLRTVPVPKEYSSYRTKYFEVGTYFLFSSSLENLVPYRYQVRVRTTYIVPYLWVWVDFDSDGASAREQTCLMEGEMKTVDDFIERQQITISRKGFSEIHM